MSKLKIFLSYHKNTPCYKSDIFQPIHVGAGVGVNDNVNKLTPDFAIADNTNENISYLNPYYCELTGHYWVLKNYLQDCNEEYIGFAHYRRLPDLLNVSNQDLPSIYGINYPQSLKLFEELNNADLYKKIKDYDIIYPCSCYMYENTVNPLLRENEPHYNVYEHFKKEHKNELLDVLQMVISEFYPDYKATLENCYNSEKSYFYNIYIMKIAILKDFLEWQFSILNKVGIKIGGWEQEKYKRMAGFLGETLMSIWLQHKKNDLKIGFTPIYMIDFEAEYIEKANYYHQRGLLKEEIAELEKLLKISANKFEVLFGISELYAQLDDSANLIKYFAESEHFAQTAEDYYQLANLSVKYNLLDNKKISELYCKALNIDNKNDFIARTYLFWSEKTHDLSINYQAWEYLNKIGLSDDEKIRYSNFIKIYKMVLNDK